MPEYPDNSASVTFVTTWVSPAPHEEQVPATEQDIVLIRLPAQKQPSSVAFAFSKIMLVESRNFAYALHVLPIPFQQVAVSFTP